MPSPSDIYKFLSELFAGPADRPILFMSGVVFGVAAVALAWWYVGRLGTRNAEAEADKYKILAEREQERTDTATRELEVQKGKSAELRVRLSRLEEDYREREKAFRKQVRDEFRRQISEKVGYLNKVHEERLAAARKSDEATQSQLASLARMDGGIWERPPGASAPEFVPLSARSAAVVAVLNLKGGVGKTTITANLARAAWGRGRRVLLLDLDYQQSLSELLLPRERRDAIRAQKRRISDMFDAVEEFAPDGVLASAEEIPESERRARILVSGERLADAEMRAMAAWFARATSVDVRFLLRRLLHAPSVQAEFDLILLDCPPRLHTACVNALTSADYVLIPVQPDKLSSDPAPALLEWLRSLKPRICPNLEVLGIVANRVHMRNNRPIKAQQDVWSELKEKCRNAYGTPVHQFAAMIRQAASTDRSAFLTDLETSFEELLTEIESRVPQHANRGRAVAR